MDYVQTAELWQKFAIAPENAGAWRYCSGCGLGTAQQAVARAILDLKINPRRVVSLVGSGCYAPMGEQLGLSGYHGAHGRSVAVGVGVKLANPALKVLCLLGDGDALAIGGNHFIQAARRNVDLTVVIFNNFGYSETGGQYGPTTPRGAITETSQFGCPEEPFDICNLAVGAGATYVARSTAYHNMLTARLITAAMEHKGFSVVEVLINCHEIYGKRNGGMSAVDMFEWFRDSSVPVEESQRLKPEELKGKWIIGELHRDTSRPEFVETYLEIVARAQARAATRASASA